MAAPDLDRVVEHCHLALGEFMKGNPEPAKELFSHGGDVTLGNPFGPFARGWEQVSDAMDRAAANYRDGEAVGFDTVARCVAPTLAYLVEVERLRAKVGGREEITPLALRVTSILHLDDGTWKVVHRHADPITSARPADSLLQH